PTYILNGTTVNANVSGALPTATLSALSMDSSGTGSSVLALGASQSVASLAGAATSTITLGSYTLTVNGTASTAFNGTMSGTGGSLSKGGSGTLTLNGNNTYTGTTTISAGTLQIGTTGTLAPGNVTVSGGAELRFNYGGVLTVANAISGAGNVTQVGSNELTLSGNNTASGAVTATSGTLKFSGANALSSATSLLSANTATLSLADGTARTTTLTTGNLSLSNAVFHMDIDTTSDRLTLSGGSASLTGNNTIHLNFLSGISSGATWTLISALSGLNGTWVLDPTFSGTPQSGFTFSLTSNATTLALIATPSSGGTTWTGDTSGYWNVASNWSGGVVPGTNSELLFSSNSTLSGGAASLTGNNTIHLNFLSGISTGATWTLISALSGMNGTWVLDPIFSGAAKSGFNFSLSSNATTLSLIATPSAGATTWTGDTSGFWNVASNWSGGVVPSSEYDTLFSANSTNNLTTTLGEDLTVKSLLIERGGVTINSGNTLTASGSGASTFSITATNGTVTINANLAGADAGLIKTGAGTLVLGGTNTYGGG
ncbi:MAG: autotransporter-associated beta strand repeat-containing protein, partial [Deltaproteobacteria bacterium]